MTSTCATSRLRDTSLDLHHTYVLSLASTRRPLTDLNGNDDDLTAAAGWENENTP